MKRVLQETWELLISVKLALFTLFTLAATSIIGTIIEQGEPAAFYIKKYGDTLANLFMMLDIPDMYRSPWFMSLLGLFAINLLCCSIERIPKVWRLVTQNNLDKAEGDIARMKNSASFKVCANPDLTANEVGPLLAQKGWKTRKKATAEGTVFFAEKGAWTRFGVYAVHLSILVVFAGAIIGSAKGFKADVALPEGGSTSVVYGVDQNHTPIDLGFQLHCDQFSMDFYDNGAPKEYRSKLVVVKDGKEVLRKTIEVNDPLEFGGLTFYQSSFQPDPNYYVFTIKNGKTNQEQHFFVPPGRKFTWPEGGVAFGIKATNPDGHGHGPYKVWFSDNKDTPLEFMANDKEPVMVQGADAAYSVMVRQHFYTILRVAKDPGVWVVYAGCILMLLGLYVVFFHSHRRIWVFVGSTPQSSKIVMGGTANKNKYGFEKEFSGVHDLLQNIDNPNLK